MLHVDADADFIPVVTDELDLLVDVGPSAWNRKLEVEI
jgi:hypothetical protein